MRIHLADPPPLLRRPPSPRGNKDQFGEFRTRNSFFPYILFPKRPRDSFEARLIERATKDLRVLNYHTVSLVYARQRGRGVSIVVL